MTTLTSKNIMIALFFFLIIIPSMFIGMIWGEYNALTQNPDLFGLVGYVMTNQSATFNSMQAFWSLYIITLMVLMLLFIFKLRQGRIV